MANRSKVKALVYDQDTGEQIDVGNIAVLRSRARFRENYMALFQAPLLEAAKLSRPQPAGSESKRLSGEALGVLLFLLGKTQLGNGIDATASTIAEELNMQLSNVSRCLAALEAAGIIVKDRRRLSLSMDFGWRGKVRDHGKPAAKTSESAPERSTAASQAEFDADIEAILAANAAKQEAGSQDGG